MSATGHLPQTVIWNACFYSYTFQARTTIARPCSDPTWQRHNASGRPRLSSGHRGESPDKRKYDTLKNRLVSAYTRSKDAELRNLLTDMELGDPKPSQLLRSRPSLTNPSLDHSNATQEVRHHVVTTGPPVAERPRRLFSEKLKVTSNQWASPLYLVPKRDKSWCPCNDYRKLNAVTKADKYPMKHIEDIVGSLNGKRVFSKVNFLRAYHLIPMSKEDIPKTARITPFGLYEFTGMTFGLRNAAQTFQRFIDAVIQGLDSCPSYLDDILVYSENESEYEIHLRTLFKRLKDSGAVPNTTKSVGYLGHMISETGVRPLDSHVQAIREYRQPISIKDLR